MFKLVFFTKAIRYICVLILGLVNIIDDMLLQMARYVITKTIQRLEKEEQHDMSAEMNIQFLKNDLLFLEKENFRTHEHILKCILYRSVHVRTEIYGLILFSEDSNVHITVYDCNNNKIACNIERKEAYSIIRLHVPCFFERVEFMNVNKKTVVKLLLNKTGTETHETTIKKRKHIIYNTAFLLNNKNL